MIEEFFLVLPGAACLRPTATLYARAIELGLELGFEKPDLGISALTQTALVEFKERWGASRRPAAFYATPIQGKASSTQKIRLDGGRAPAVAQTVVAVNVPGGNLLSRRFCGL